MLKQTEKLEDQATYTPPVVPAAVNPASPITLEGNSYQWQLDLLKQRAETTTDLTEFVKINEMISKVRQEQGENARELRQDLLNREAEAQRQHTEVAKLVEARRDATEARRMQFTAACLCGLPGTGLLIAAVLTGHWELTLVGGPLIGIGASALTERVTESLKSWFGGRHNDGDKGNG